MIPGYDVALNKAGVAQVGAQPGQPFSYQGRQYRWGDNVPELYSDARMDIFDPYYGPQTGQKHAPYAFGDGGIVREPTVALLGEKGPEAVVPLKRDELEDYLSRGEIPNLAGTQKFWTQTLTQEPMPSSSEFEQWKKAKAQDFLRRIPGSADEPARVPLEQYPRMNLADPDVLHVNATRALEQMQRVVDATYATTGSEQLR
jgi:hypothetical protein